MKKGELISACIKIMFENDGEIDYTTISSNQNYESITSRVIDSINRAFIRVWGAHKFDYAEETKTYANNTNSNFMILTIKPDDIISITRVNENKGYIENGIKWNAINTSKIILPSLKEDEKYYIEKIPNVPIVTSSMSDTEDICMQDGTLIRTEIMGIIPYFVKGDLLEEDNASMAVLAKNTFESYLDEIPSKYINKVESVYGDL